MSNVSDIQRAIDYHEHCLNIAKELGDQAAEQRQYSCLGNSHQKLKNFIKAKSTIKSN